MAGIPPPKNLRQLERRTATMGQLQDALGGWDKDTFTNLRKYVQHWAEMTHLDREHRAEQQDQEKWNEFEHKAVIAFPNLNNYQNHWPLAMYYNRWTSDRAHHKRTKIPSPAAAVDEKSNSAGSHSSDSEDDDVPLSSRSTQNILRSKNAAKRRIESVDIDEGPAKRRVTRSAAKAAAQATSAAPQVAERPKVSYYIGKNPKTFKRTKAPVTPDDDSSDGMDSDSRQRHPTQSTRNSASSGTLLGTPEQSVNNWPMWCAFCGVAPAVPEDCIKELRQLFEEDVLGVLANIGILHDLHLRVLSTLEESQRREFLLSLVPEKFSQLTACEISEMFNEYAKQHAGGGIPGGEVEICFRHQAQHAVDVPSELRLLLEARGMEEVGPAAVFLGIDSNARFQTSRTFKVEAKKKMIFENMKGIKPSLFQNLMLELALAPAS
ncbi:hypothetical protein FB451DRAFT_1412993 [Mycena latifolia]|nr:hypothetical protein FB451DRAFT_1412993 [Mycena latifolia]